MTDAELEELEALLAACMPGDWRVCPYRLAVVLDDEKGEMQVADIRGWGHLTGRGVGAHGMSDEAAEAIQKAHAELIARSKRALGSAISTIRSLREENAELKRDRAPVTPEALAWGKEEAARIEAKEAARDRVVEAARSGKAILERINELADEEAKRRSFGPQLAHEIFVNALCCAAGIGEALKDYEEDSAALAVLEEKS